MRMAAGLIVKLQKLVQDRMVLSNIHVEYKDRCVQVTNLLALVSLRIGQGEEFKLVFNEDMPDYVLHGITDFFEKVENEDNREVETDRLLMENSVIFQEAVANLPNGMIVVNSENVIIYVNESATKLLEMKSEELLSKNASDVIPHSKLQEVIDSGEIQFAEKQKLRNYSILANRAPIIFNEKIIGAVSIIQDITDIENLNFQLKKERELQEKLNLVLESVSDLIALTDQNGNFTYMNAQMEQLLTHLKLRSYVLEMVSKTEWRDIVDKKDSFVKVVKFLSKDKYILKINPLLLDEEFKGVVLSLSPYNEMRELLQKMNLMEQRTKYLEQELSKHMKLDDAFQTIVGNSETLLETLSMANKVSKTNATILITGESGTGKELVARAIHQSSKNKDGPFIRVNCAAIAPNLIESELFGHEKGAFTGAIKAHQGKFELAHNGTIFLDEIGDLPLDIQVKLLRVLQEREIERVGGSRTLMLNVRVVAATHHDLNQMVEEGAFREDLYYRLHVIPIHLPSLKSRKEDIPLLVDHFRKQFNQQLERNIKGYESGFLEALGSYHWPGNIRELQNVMERVMTLADEEILSLHDLPKYILNRQASSSQLKISGDILLFEEYERHIFEYAAQYYPSYNQLAKALGLTHKTVAAKLKKYGIVHELGKKYQHVGEISQPN